MKHNRFFFPGLTVLFLVFSILVLPVQANLIVGTGSGGQGFVEDQHGPDASNPFTNRSWPRVNWPAYNNSGNAQVHPATGDMDGDGQDEVVMGLSSAANGWFEVLDDQASGFAHMKWLRVSWSGYNSDNGETWPATGDVDGDDKDEIILGLGHGSSGWVEIKDDAGNGFSNLTWLQVGWGQYTGQSNDYTRPGAGDVDGDGNDEVILGLSDASNGWVEVKEDQSGNFDTMKWIQTNWGGYNSKEGETRPTSGDLDGDGSDEIVLGLGPGSDGWLEIKDDDFSNLDWIQVGWGAYAGGDKDGTRPDVGNLDSSDDAKEIVIGLSSAGNGWMEAKQGENEGYSTISWTKFNWNQYIGNNGETWPAILVSGGSSISSPVNVTQVDGGSDFSIALKSDGTVWSWGGDTVGQLGNGGAGGSPKPVQVLNSSTSSPIDGIVSITAGDFHGHAIKSGGFRLGWGSNETGQVGDNSPGGVGALQQAAVPLATPPNIESGDRLISLEMAAGGLHTLHLNDDNGTVWAWGSNGSGQLGTNIGNDLRDNNNNGQVDEAGENGSFAAIAVQVDDLTGVTNVAAGRAHSVALTTQGRVWTWGAGARGQLGGGLGVRSNSPIQVIDQDDSTGYLTGIEKIAAGDDHTIALKANGTVWTWGSNSKGQLGNPRVAIGGASAFVGQVGSLDSNNELLPLQEVVDIAAGAEHSLAVKGDGTVWAWGNNSSGELGINSGVVRNMNKPVKVSNISSAVDVAAGARHSLIVKENGTVWAWGSNQFGQVGDNTQNNNKLAPVGPIIDLKK